MFKWTPAKSSRASSPARRSAKKAGPSIGVDGEPYLEGRKLLFGFEPSHEEAAFTALVEVPAAPGEAPPPPTPAPPALPAPSIAEDPDEIEVAVRATESAIHAAGCSLLPRVPSDAAASLLAVAAGVGIAPFAAAAAAAAQLSFAAIGIAAGLSAVGAAAAVSNAAPEPYADYKDRMVGSTSATVLPYACCLGGESIRRKALRARVLTRTAHFLEICLGLLSCAFAYDLYLAVPFTVSQYYPFVVLGDAPDVGAQASYLACAYQLLCALVCFTAFRGWAKSEPAARIRQMVTGEAYGRLAEAPMTYAEYLAANQPKVGLEEKGCLGKVGER